MVELLIIERAKASALSIKISGYYYVHHVRISYVLFFLYILIESNTLKSVVHVRYRENLCLGQFAF